MTWGLSTTGSSHGYRGTPRMFVSSCCEDADVLCCRVTMSKELPGFTPRVRRTLSLRQAERHLALSQHLSPLIACGSRLTPWGQDALLPIRLICASATHGCAVRRAEIKLGWPPGYGIAQLTALVGKSRALEMCLMGEPISDNKGRSPNGDWSVRLFRELPSPSEACRSPKRRALDACRGVAEPPNASIHLDEGSQPKVAHCAAERVDPAASSFRTPQEGIEAFIEKRTPRFRGS
jgi:hypothetical protein